MGKLLSGKTVSSANGHLSYEIYEMSSDFVTILANLLEKTFGFKPITPHTFRLNEIITDIEKDGVRLGIGWDNWSGVYVMAFCEQGDSYITQIANFLNNEFEQAKYCQYPMEKRDPIDLKS